MRTLSIMEDAFKKSYLHNVAVATEQQVIEFLIKGGAQFYQDYGLGGGEYTSLMDAWGVWRDAIGYAIENEV
jgi:hypothetical protein